MYVESLTVPQFWTVMRRRNLRYPTQVYADNTRMFSQCFKKPTDILYKNNYFTGFLNILFCIVEIHLKWNPFVDLETKAVFKFCRVGIRDWQAALLAKLFLWDKSLVKWKSGPHLCFKVMILRSGIIASLSFQKITAFYYCFTDCWIFWKLSGILL